MDKQLEVIKDIQENPVYFVEGIFGDTLWQKQQDIINSIRDFKYTTVRSCHGAGKSFIAARIVLWFLYSFANSKVITTAPTFRQVEDILWREIASAMSKKRFSLEGQLNQTSLDLGNDWFALGLSTNEPSRFQGFHATHILLIVDEASGVPQNI